MAKIKIILFERYLSSADILKGLLETEGCRVISVSRDRELFDMLRKEDVDVLVIDLRDQEREIFYILEELKGILRNDEIVVIADFHRRDGIRAAGELLKIGIRNIIPLDTPHSELKALINQIHQRKRLSKEFQKLFEETMEFWELSSVYQKGIKMLFLDNPDFIPKKIIEILSEETEACGGKIFLKSDFDDKRYEGYTSHFINPVLSERQYCLVGDEEEGIFDEGRRMTLILKITNETVGIVDLYRTPSMSCFDMEVFRKARLLGKFATIAIKIFLKIRNAGKTSIKDDIGIFYSYPVFKEFAIKEIQKSKRYKRPMSFVIIKIEISDLHLREKLIEGINREILSIIGKTFRDSDTICNVGNNEYLLILPETDYLGSLIAIRRFDINVKDHISKFAPDLSHSISITGRAVTFPKHGEEISLLERELDRRFRDLKQSLYFTLNLNQSTFWQCVSKIYSVSHIDPFISRSSRLVLNEQDLVLMHNFLMDELIKVNNKGILYILKEDLRENFDIFKLPIKNARDVKIYLICRRITERLDHTALFPIQVDDERLSKNRIYLYLSGDFAYGLIGRRMGDLWDVFHTSDEYLIERLIYKVQEEYKLQLQL